MVDAETRRDIVHGARGGRLRSERVVPSEPGLRADTRSAAKLRSNALVAGWHVFSMVLAERLESAVFAEPRSGPVGCKHGVVAANSWTLSAQHLATVLL